MTHLNEAKEAMNDVEIIDQHFRLTIFFCSILLKCLYHTHRFFKYVKRGQELVLINYSYLLNKNFQIFTNTLNIRLSSTKYQ